tara:strand:+ start:2367 stop:4310 length:1944 start_codon:yes stop_codon:yes gene_type:complete
MYGQIGSLLVLCVILTQIAEAGQTRLSRQSLPLHHTLYEQLQGEYRSAYGVAEYYKLKGQVSPELILVQASASLELGYLAHGRELINDLDEGSLLPENQSRLHLYLARDAYRRRDWPLLDTHLEALEQFNLDDRHYYFLLAESARINLRFEAAEVALENLDLSDVYQFYGRFNLASSVVDRDPATAARHLQSLVALPARNLEQLLLTERGRVALADIYLAESAHRSNAQADTLNANIQNKQAREDRLHEDRLQEDRLHEDWARQVLAKVSASYQYGPMALARLARIDMQAGHYENAAAIWHHLWQNYPWHRAATAAPSGLGYALLQSSGEEAAYGTYLTALDTLESQSQSLSDFGNTLSDQLHNPDWVLGKANNESNESNDGNEGSLLLWLAKGLGHDDWTSWLADESVQRSARRWQSLDLAYKDLKRRQQDLSILQVVDAEQLRRTEAARKRIQEDDLAVASDGLIRTLEADLSDLSTRNYRITDDLSRFATAEEAALLKAIDQLSVGHGQTEMVRISRLKGLVTYQIYEAIPKRRQQQRDLITGRLAAAQTLKQRITRINSSAAQLPSSALANNNVSRRITQLSAAADTLSQRTAVALGNARGSLIASMMDYIDQDQRLLTAQANGLEYDIARLLDRQFLAEAAP